MANILVFGGSNVYGVWDSEGGWVERLKNNLPINGDYINHLVYNLGIPASNSGSVLDRVQFEIRQRVSSDDDNIIIFDVGKNDSSVSKSTGEFNNLPSTFLKNVSQIIGAAKLYAKKIVFLSLLPVDEEKTNPVYWNKNLSYKNSHTEKYNILLKDLCDAKGAYFIDVYPVIKSRTNWQEMFADGLHLNEAGHKIVFELVKDYLTDNKLIKEHFLAISEPVA